VGHVVALHGSSSGGSSDRTPTKQTEAPDPEWNPDVSDSAVGRYVVLEEVGRGGMGRVTRAYDPKLQREVALKELRRSRLDEENTLRLVAEARAMAQLAHPNVVTVFDVEDSPAQTVVLVMEYVEGQTLKGWLREQTRSWLEIVEAFVRAGRGLVAAHDAGLLHRDFKPSNVLVASDGAIKVTDFGLAKTKAGGRDSSEDTQVYGLTQVGRVIGTPRYMPPEQYDGRALTPAADQYAFCVALWEALHGAPPFPREATLADRRRGPPKWAHPATPAPIAEAVMRGLCPSAEDRWPSMRALLDALEWDPSRRRRRWGLALGGLLLFAAGGIWVSAWSMGSDAPCEGGRAEIDNVWNDARRSEVRSAFEAVGRTYADEASVHTGRALDLYRDAWADMHRESCEATTVRGEQSAALMDLRMSCLRRSAASLDATVETLAAADAAVVQRAHEIVGGLPRLSRCADAAALMAEVQPPDESEALAVAAVQAQFARVEVLRRAGRLEQAFETLDGAREVLEGIEYPAAHTERMLQEGLILANKGEYQAAVSMLEKVLERSVASGHRGWMRTASNQLMHVVGDKLGRPEHALRYRPIAEGLSRTSPLHEAAFRNKLATVLVAQGKLEDAEAEHRRALALRIEALGPEHPRVAASLNDLAVALIHQGRYAEAEPELRTALDLRLRQLGPEHPYVASTRNNYAAALWGLDEFVEAEAEFRAAQAINRDALGPEHPHVAMAHSNIASSLAEQGRVAEAEAELRTAIEQQTRSLGAEHRTVIGTQAMLASILEQQGKLADAEQLHRIVLTRRIQEHGPDHDEVAVRRSRLASVLIELEQLSEAMTLAEQAWQQVRAGEAALEDRAAVAFVLARALLRAPDADRDRARALAEQARDDYARSGKPEDSLTVERWLDAL